MNRAPQKRENRSPGHPVRQRLYDEERYPEEDQQKNREISSLIRAGSRARRLCVRYDGFFRACGIYLQETFSPLWRVAAEINLKNHLLLDMILSFSI
jgi:hypothetical protein